MELPAILHEGWLEAIVNHLWQSTFVAVLAWLLTLALKRNQARSRRSSRC
jgi:bla regulator protein blaR1